MFGYIEEALQDAENDPFVNTRDAAFFKLRTLGLDDFGEILLGMPNSDYPRLSALLPIMASDASQDLWTGTHGIPMLKQSSTFVRSCSYNYTRFTGQVLSNAKILDFGSGYGRLARLFYYFTNSKSLVGVDPWDRSIEECADANLGDNFYLSDYLPKSIPGPIDSFDFAYAFSVFTHLSERATIMSLAAIRGAMRTGGLACITIRPIEFWDGSASAASEPQRMAAKQKHLDKGFAFFPHALAPVDGEVTYGDTSMTMDWLVEHAPGWKIAGIDRSLEDPYQIYVFLKAV